MNKKQISILAILVVVALFFTFGLYAYNKRVNDEQTLAAQNNRSALERSDAPSFGASNAKVTIVEFFDPACETCKEFHPFVKALVKENPGRIRSVLRYAPLHNGSDQVVKALEAARLQNLYWPALEALLDGQGIWASHHNPDINQIWPLLRSAGVNIEQARQDMNSADIAAMVQRDIADLATFQVTKTPTFFVNGKPLPRFGYEPLKQLVSDEVKIQYGNP